MTQGSIDPGRQPSRRLSAHALNPYRQPVAGLRDRPHLPARYVVVSKAHFCRRQQVMEEALGLHIGEMQAKTHMRAAAKGHPGILVTRADSLVRKAQWIKLERLRPDFRHAVREDGVDGNTCASRMSRPSNWKSRTAPRGIPGTGGLMRIASLKAISKRASSPSRS